MNGKSAWIFGESRIGEKTSSKCRRINSCPSLGSYIIVFSLHLLYRL